MYLKNQRSKRTNDKKTLKPLKVTTYSKIKNKQRKNRSKDLVQDQPPDQILAKGSINKKKLYLYLNFEDKTNEIEKYFLKRVGDTSRKNLNADLTKPNTFEASCKNAQGTDKTKKSEFDLINQYLDCSRITAFNNYLSNKDLPKFNLSKQEDENKNSNISKEFSFSQSQNKSEKNDEEKFSIDFLVKQFKEPFEKNKMIYLKRAEIVRKELIEVYQLKLPNELNKNTIDDHLIDLDTKSSEVGPFDLFVPNVFLNDSLTKKNIQLKNKAVLKDLKLEDLYYD
ncbi:hypothetical protein BpHYR1_032303 [Brachionus plicatilis]|uniref:Uncharacterized protein n=1 Tax=Brachionus plicatilis TaxID=10195 RepID=A0A3M7Q5L9_BRAPC|nr:hypothetical protein BpHYR1_032303 [Brachionus plicatilis]